MAEYPNAGTRLVYRKGITAIIGRPPTIAGPDDLTLAHITRTIEARNANANNTIRSMISATRLFLRWCHEIGLRGEPVNERGLARLLRTYPVTYGKAQAARPARWLSHDEAFTALITACQDQTDKGLRDEIVIRLGLLGLRNAEIRELTVANFSALPTITWLAKGRKVRAVKVGPAFLELFDRYLRLYTDGIARSPLPHDPIICQEVRRQDKYPGALVWGTGYDDHPYHIHRIVTARARTAGLGHVAPHDLRRTMAGILHKKLDGTGAHHYDLRDIQKALGHARPETTARYLELLDTDVLDRAAHDLD